MAIDTSGLASIGDSAALVNPAESRKKALTIKDLMDREQLNSLAVGEAKRTSAENVQVQDLLKKEGIDYSSPEGVMKTAEKINKISPRAGMEFMSQAQKWQSGQVQQQIDQLELLDHQQGLVVNVVDGIINQARDMKTKGADDMVVNAFIAKQLPGAIQTLQNTKLPNGQSALSPAIIQQINESTKQGPVTIATLEGWEQKSKAGHEAIKARLEQFKANTQAKGEAEKETHDRATEEHAAKMEELTAARDANKAATDKEGKLTDEAVDLAARRLVNGEKAQDVLANFGRGRQGPGNIAAVQNRFASLAKEEGMSPDEIALRQQEMKGSARAELELGAREGKIAPRVQEAKKFAEIALKRSDDVPRGDWKGLNKLLQVGAEQSSDPKLGAFQAANISLVNAYAAAIGGGTVHVHDQEVGLKLLSTAEGPAGYKARVQQLIVETETALKAPEDVKEQWRQTREQDAETRTPRPGATPPAHPAGAPPPPPPGFVIQK